MRRSKTKASVNRVTGDKAWLPDTYGWPGRFHYSVDWLAYHLTDLLTAARPPITLRAAVAAAAPRPILLITAGRTTDEAIAAESIRSASLNTVDVWTVPGATHVGGLRTQHEEWSRRVVTFLGAGLK